MVCIQKCDDLRFIRPGRQGLAYQPVKYLRINPAYSMNVNGETSDQEKGDCINGKCFFCYRAPHYFAPQSALRIQTRSGWQGTLSPAQPRPVTVRHSSSRLVLTRKRLRTLKALQAFRYLGIARHVIRLSGFVVIGLVSVD